MGRFGSLTRLELLAWFLFFILSVVVGFLGYVRFVQTPPIKILYNTMEPRIVFPGQVVMIKSGGLKTRACPVDARWQILDSSGLLFTLEAPAGFHDPADPTLHLQRPMIIPSTIAPGYAKFWEEITYRCWLREFEVFTDKVDFEVVEP